MSLGDRFEKALKNFESWEMQKTPVRPTKGRHFQSGVLPDAPSYGPVTNPKTLPFEPPPKVTPTGSVTTDWPTLRTQTLYGKRTATLRKPESRFKHKPITGEALDAEFQRIEDRSTKAKKEEERRKKEAEEKKQRELLFLKNQEEAAANKAKATQSQAAEAKKQKEEKEKKERERQLALDQEKAATEERKRQLALDQDKTTAKKPSQVEDLTTGNTDEMSDLTEGEPGSETESLDADALATLEAADAINAAALQKKQNQINKDHEEALALASKRGLRNLAASGGENSKVKSNALLREASSGYSEYGDNSSTAGSTESVDLATSGAEDEHEQMLTVQEISMEAFESQSSDNVQAQRESQRVNITVTVVPIWVRNPVKRKTKVNALLDSGANTNAIDASVAENLLGLRGRPKKHYIKVAGGDTKRCESCLGVLEEGSLAAKPKFHKTGAPVYHKPCCETKGDDWTGQVQVWPHPQDLPVAQPVKNKQVDLILGTGNFELIVAR